MSLSVGLKAIWLIILQMMKKNNHNNHTVDQIIEI